VGNITLIGFMGTGKTEVGRLVAQRLGMEFVDCDALIEKQTGLTVPEIFERSGEPRFRELERRAVARVSGRWGKVVATGGGAPKDPDNMAALKCAGIVACLTARPDVIWERTRASGERPMLAAPDPRARITELLEDRRACYAQADLSIDTSDLTIAQAVEAVIAAATTVDVRLGERGYRIVIRGGALDEIGPAARRAASGGRVAIISNPVVLGLYGERVRASLGGSEIDAVEIAVPAGERQKTLRRLGIVLQEMLAAGLDRSSAVIALGGGVIGDLAGFAAATYMRGIGYIQAPTTLLAQVDSSIGGKVAVDLPQAKNLAGAFYQPAGVVADLDTLRSLPAREFRQGLAEVVKHAIIADARLFEYLESRRKPLLRRDPAVLLHTVRRSCEIKADVVARDEREHGLRAILNYGHTFAHAIETWGGYRAYRHGDAVAIGMLAAARLAEGRRWLAVADAERIESLIAAMGLPTAAPDAPPDELARIMAADKKARGGRLRFVLPRSIGVVEIANDVRPEEIARSLAAR
jgi:shikimate kinase/3-dehydroquinate synthase